jgi:sec-independent protein translocase protein TatA
MFDPSAPHIIILLVVVLLLFGAGRMPGAAKALGQSMHIFKKSVHGEDENGQPLNQGGPATTATAPVPPAVLPAAAAPQTQHSQPSF